MDIYPQTWTLIFKKWKVPNQEEAIIALAKIFSSFILITIQQAAITIVHFNLFEAFYNEWKFKIKKFTTLDYSHKQVTVFISSPIKWMEDVVFNQISSHLENTKHSIWVTSVESSRSGLSLATTDVSNKNDLEVFTTLFESELEQRASKMDLRIKIPTSKLYLKICDFLYYSLLFKHNEKTGKLIPLMIEQISKILNVSPFAKDFLYYKNFLP